MKCYRIIKEKHHREDRDFLKVEYSAKEPGRWNKPRQPVLYTGDSIETVVAEAGVYWILNEAQKLNRMATKGKAPTAWEDSANIFKEIPAKIAELEIDPNLKLCLIGPPASANTKLTEANLGHIHHAVYLKHAYRALKGVPTREFGEWLQEQKFDGFQIASARRAGGLCTVFFSPKATQGAVRVSKVIDTKFFGLKNNGARMDSKFATYDELKFEYELNGAVNTSSPDKHP